MDKVLQFGEKVDGYDLPVLNEREVRAGAGLLFLLAMVAFMNSWLKGDFYWTRLFVVAFMIDFTIRVFVNPRYSPSMIIGRLFVVKQQAEYVGAPQKRFAWSIGLALSVAMFFLIVVKDVIGPVNLAICLTCLLLLFFESAFGICLACKVFNLFSGNKATLCPGNTCEATVVTRAGKIGATELLIVSAFFLAIGSIGKMMPNKSVTSAVPAVLDTAASEKCKVPDWAVAMGHAEKWKLHNNCPTSPQ